MNPDKNEKSLGRTRVYDTWMKRQSSNSQPLGNHIQPRYVWTDNIVEYYYSQTICTRQIGFICYLKMVLPFYRSRKETEAIG